MGQPSFQASNAVIYLTYGAFLSVANSASMNFNCVYYMILGLYIAWRHRKQSKSDFISSNRTQKATPLALNFIASALGSGILFTYPEISTIAGVQGLVVYALASALPLMIFAVLGPIIRKKTPEGFVLTEWARQRYGIVTAIYLSALTLITMFLYMVSELSALQQIITTLTGLNGLPVVIVECVVTTIYTSIGGFRVSFVTDNIQGAMVIGMIILGVITVGVKTDIDRSMIESSGYLNASLLGWQLIYILPIAILTNDFFLSNFWMRTFASESDRELIIGVSIATFIVLCILVLIGSAGLLATWSHAFDPNNPDQEGSISLFYLLEQMPGWVVGIVLVMTIALSCSAFDSFQSAMVSSASNDLFRNKLNIWWIRAGIVLIIFPVVVIALKSPDILTIFLISDLVSAAAIPVLLIGLSERCYWWRGFEVVVGGLGGILTVFIFGTIYFGDARKGANLILLENGLYGNDWSAFGAFVAAPVGGLLWGFGALGLRLGVQWVLAKVRKERFGALDRPLVAAAAEDDAEEVDGAATEVSSKSGKFF